MGWLRKAAKSGAVITLPQSDFSVFPSLHRQLSEIEKDIVNMQEKQEHQMY